MKRREDGAVREVMKELLRSDLRFHKTDCGRFGAMTAWGLKDTSSRPAKDLGGTLRHTLRTMLRSYYRYEDGKRVKHTVTPVLGEKAAHNGKVVYSLDFEVTPHQLRILTLPISFMHR